MHDPIGRAREAWAQEALASDYEPIEYDESLNDFDGHAADNCYDCDGTGEREEFLLAHNGAFSFVTQCPCPCHLDTIA